MAVAVRLGLLAFLVVGWGWWTGGRTALLGRDTFANATNATIISPQRAHRPLRFSLSVVDKREYLLPHGYQGLRVDPDQLILVRSFVGDGVFRS